MDEGLHEPVKATRLLAWRTAGLLVAGAVSVEAVDGNDDAAEWRIVPAAGAGLGAVDAPMTMAAPSTTKAAGARLTVVNQHPFSVKVTVNGVIKVTPA